MRQSSTRSWYCVAAIMAAAVSLSLKGAHAFPEPSLIPTSWRLTIKYKHPAAIAVRLPGEGSPTMYWYFTYTVTNNTGADQTFVPEITLMTEAGDLIRAN